MLPLVSRLQSSPSTASLTSSSRTTMTTETKESPDPSTLINIFGYPAPFHGPPLFLDDHYLTGHDEPLIVTTAYVLYVSALS